MKRRNIRASHRWRLGASLVIGLVVNLIFITQPLFATALDIAYEAATPSVGVGYCDGGPGDGHGYCRRNCTSYTAYRLKTAGVPIHELAYLGNGGQWYENAIKRGLSVGSQPQVGAAAVIPGNPGHVAYVEAINPDDSIQVASYNGYTESYYPEKHATRYRHFVYFNVSKPAATLSSQTSTPPEPKPNPPANVQPTPVNTATVQVLQGKPVTSFITPGSNPDNWNFLQADYDQDDVPDMVAINRDDNGKTAVVIVDGTDVTKKLLEHTTALPALAGDARLALADYDQDNVPDIYALVPQANGSLQLTIIDGAAPATVLLSSAAAGSLNSNHFMMVADYNNDQIPDIYLIDKQAWAAGKDAVMVLDGAKPTSVLQLIP